YWPASRFPGYAALLPCCGTAAIILAGRASTPAGNRLLSVPPAVFLGKISYSLYLGHWPLYAFTKFYLDRDLFACHAAPLLAGWSVPAIVSWYFIETPLRGPNPILVRKSLFAAAGLSIAVIIAYGTSGILSNGYPQRYSPDVLALLAPMQEPPPTAECPRY